MEIILENVTKVYDNGVRALSDLNLAIRAGELLALVGPSGCGKTTTLRLIAGLEEPTAGSIRIGGRVVNSLPPRQRNVGMVFQRPALFPQRTVRSNLQFGLDLQQNLLRRWFSPMDKQSQIDETARTLGLQNELERLPAELSGGQEQRVALGRVLIRHPEVLLLDEPLGHLDGPLRLDLRRQLHLLHKQFPATMVYVTHDPLEALALGDRVAVLDGGTLQQIDVPEELFYRPVNRQVARLMCQGQLNLLDGRLRGENNLVLALDGQEIALPEERATAWRDFRDRHVSVGIRPEDMVISAKNPGAGVLFLQVDLIESIGEGFKATCTGRGLVVTGLCQTKFARGQQVMPTICWQKTWLFDGLTGRTLSSRTG
jgi:ABC-type sugar transport system ATPase subunit